MADTHNVFISWSGERSRQAAEALREWLKLVLQNSRPWISTEIEKGSRSFDEIARALEGMKVGIICLTPENLTSEWLHYEAGALSKTPDAKTRVCTYLLADLDSATVKPPLSWFQWTKANKTDTRKLIATINKHLGTDPLDESTLDITFDAMWPKLERRLDVLPSPTGTPPSTRSTDDKINELLELTRAMAPDLEEIAREAKRARNIRQLTVPPQSYEISSGQGLFSDLASQVGEGAVAGLAGVVPGSADTPTEPSKRAVPLPLRAALKNKHVKP